MYRILVFMDHNANAGADSREPVRSVARVWVRQRNVHIRGVVFFFSAVSKKKTWLRIRNGTDRRGTATSVRSAMSRWYAGHCCSHQRDCFRISEPGHHAMHPRATCFSSSEPGHTAPGVGYVERKVHDFVLVPRHTLETRQRLGPHDGTGRHGIG